MIRLETKRLVIRNFRVSDWEALHDMIAQYESSGLAAYDRPWPSAPEEIKKITEWFADRDSYLAVCLKAAGSFVGFVALREQSDNEREFNLGYIFDFDHHGNGYATEACRAVLRHAFDCSQARRVVTGTAAANAASCELLERLGFQRTSESITSFRQTSDGKPIQFLGYTFELSRDAWKAVDEQSFG